VAEAHCSSAARAEDSIGEKLQQARDSWLSDPDATELRRTLLDILRYLEDDE
jgi:hypothetical protein